jgi:hypothetical protein
MMYPARKFSKNILAYSRKINATAIAISKYENILIKFIAMYFELNRAPELTAIFNK